MKKQFSFMIIFVLIGVITAGIFILHSYSVEKKDLSEKTSNSLVDITKSKTKKINDYLSKMENDIGFLAESEEVKNLLKQELIFNDTIIKRDVDYRSRIISKEIENYIRAHPKMTLRDLQNSEEFRAIAVQRVGEEGYSAIHGTNNRVIYFNKNLKLEGINLGDLAEKSPELLSLLEEIENKKNNSEGFYGDFNEKLRMYSKFTNIHIKTADGVSLSVGTTAYVDDYRIIKNVSQESDKYLKNFKENSNYHNLELISSNGYVVYMAEQMRNFGANLEWSVNLKEGLSKNYFKIKDSKNNSFFGPYIGTYGDIYPKVSIMTSVYDGNNLLGFAALVDEMDKIFDITEEIMGIAETGETYLVNTEQLLISPLRNRNLDMLVQSVNTENAKNCFSMNSTMHVVHNETGESLNYGGDLVIGTHLPIFKVNWCLITEVDKNEMIDTPIRRGVWKRILISLPGILILTLIGFFVLRFIIGFKNLNKLFRRGKK